MRKILATLVVTVFAVLVFGAISEAAPTKTAPAKTNVRHRPRHSSRVATGATKKKGAKGKKKPLPSKPKAPAEKPQ
jgi:hypothetical protein